MPNRIALPVLARLLGHEHRWLQAKAAQALGGMGSTARPVVPAMLAAIARTAEPLDPIAWDDPIQLTPGANSPPRCSRACSAD